MSNPGETAERAPGRSPSICVFLVLPASYREFFPQVLQAPFLRHRKIQNLDAHPFAQFLQPHLPAIAEAEGVAVAVDRGGDLGEHHIFQSGVMESVLL